MSFVEDSYAEEREEEFADGSGETVGKAKWAAVKELQSRYHGVTGEDVEFEVMTEPILGESDAVVRATLDISEWEGKKKTSSVSEDPVEVVREVVSRIIHAIGVSATVTIEEDDDEVTVQVNGTELGLFIGREGRMVDAVQSVASQAAYRRGSKKRTIVDAAGYRERRRRSLERRAERAAAEAVRYDRPVELDPMRAGERRIIHIYLKESDDVETESEGKEPNRCVVIFPAK